MRLEGKVAFVTGASRGIGAAVARSLSDEGVAVGLASRRGDDLGLANALGLECDLRDVAQAAVCPGGVATDFALDEGHGRTPDVLATEPSWG